MASTILCPTCGENVSKKAINCSNCGNFLIQLSFLEKPRELGHTLDAPLQHFRSLKRLYQFCVFGAMVACMLIYTVFFNSLSESELVLISPLWFLAFHFGITGFYAEQAVVKVLEGEATTFRAGLSAVFGEAAPLVGLVARVVFMPPYLLLPLRRVSSPFYLSLITTVAWGFLLYFFFGAVFPSL